MSEESELERMARELNASDPQIDRRAFLVPFEGEALKDGPAFKDIFGLAPEKIHNQYCRDDWDLYHGAGPRGMGPKSDGCVCSLAPAGYDEVRKPPNELRQVGESEWAEMLKANPVPTPAKPLLLPQEILLPKPMVLSEPAPFEPKLWESEPASITHFAGVCITLFGRYMRQRCDWCGIILLEYDLTRVAVPVGQDATPGYWELGALVRVDGNMMAEVEAVEVEPGVTKLPADSCGLDPKTQVGVRE